MRPKGKTIREGRGLREVSFPSKNNENALSNCPCCLPLALGLHQCDQCLELQQPSYDCEATGKKMAEQKDRKSLGVHGIAEL